MGWGFRKSFGSKSARVTFSKSGVSFSTGVKGLRFRTGSRGTFVTGSAGGFSYRQRIGGGTQSQPSATQPGPGPTNPGHPSQGASAAFDYQKPIEEITSSNSKETIESINQTLSVRKVTGLIAVIGLITTVGAFALSPESSVIAICLWLIALFFTSKYDVENSSHPLFFELDDKSQREWNKLILELRKVKNSSRIYRILDSAYTSDYKYNSGASSLISRQRIQCCEAPRRNFKTNVDTLGVIYNQGELWFLPDMVLIFQNGKCAGLEYEHLGVLYEQTRFIESEGAPPDSQVVGQTWRYLNKDGSPDKRFNNNYSIPIVLYAYVRLQSNTGLNLHFHVSNLSIAEAFANALRARGHARLGQAGVQSAHASQSQGSTTAWYYVALGLMDSCLEQEARTRFRHLVMQYHPDKVHHLGRKAVEIAEIRMKEINSAWSELRRVRKWA